MPAFIQLYFWGNNNRPAENLKTIPHLQCSTLEDKNLSSLRGTDLVSLFEESAAEYLGFVNGQWFTGLEQLQEINALELNPDHAGIYILPFSCSEQFIQSFKNLPPQAAMLAMNPIEHAVVLIQKSAFLSLNELPDSADPLWHSLILMTQAGIQSQILRPAGVVDPRNHQFSLPQLAPQTPGRDREWLLQLLRAYEPVQDLPEIRSASDATALKAGLFCIHDYLEESHEFSQSVQNAGIHCSGDYWHHIMHRREPDSSNAKYWSRVVGNHPLLDLLPEVIPPLFDQFQSSDVLHWKKRVLENKRWSLNTFVDFCSECDSSQDEELKKLARSIQWVEMQLLLQKTSLDAVTG